MGQGLWRRECHLARRLLLRDRSLAGPKIISKIKQTQSSLIADLSSLEEPYHIQRFLYIWDFFLETDPSPLRVGFHELIFSAHQSFFSLLKRLKMRENHTRSSPESSSSCHRPRPSKRHSPRPYPRTAQMGFLVDLLTHLC